MSADADRWIKWTTTGCVALLALIAGTVSYLHMRLLVELHGQPGWVAALTPLSVDGMIVAASATLLADSRTGERGGVLPWALRGRAVAVTLIAATQRPTQKAMGQGALRSQMDVRICFRVRERKDVELILGQGMLAAGWHAHTLNAPGKLLISAPEHDTPRRDTGRDPDRARELARDRPRR